MRLLPGMLFRLIRIMQCTFPMESFSVPDNKGTMQDDCNHCSKRQEHGKSIRVQNKSFPSFKPGNSKGQKHMTETRYVERCSDSVREDSEDTEEVIDVFMMSRKISKSSSVTSCVSKVLMSSKLESWFVEELERPAPSVKKNKELIDDSTRLRVSSFLK